VNRAELVHGSVSALRAHALRTFLTALGIVFGVAAVIAMLSIGEGARRQALEQIERLGVRNIIVLDDPPRAPAEPDPESQQNQRSPGLNLEDARALRDVHPWLDEVVPQRNHAATVRRDTERHETMLVGTSPGHLRVLDQTVHQGRMFDADEYERAARVCVLGLNVHRKLFPFGGAVGRTVKVEDQWLTVIGTLEHRLPSGAEGGVERDPNDEVLMPVTTVLRRMIHQVEGSELSRLTVRVRSAEHVNEAAELVERLLLRRHRGVDDVRIVVPEALLRQQQRTQRIFNVVMGTIAGISLLVGGIGIMNIMLAAVLERTREIGIRRAVGARQRDVLAQFLTEAVVVSVLGGLIGIVLGLVLTAAIAAGAGWPVAVSLPGVALAFGVSVAVGIVFGYVPARNAARLDPIESLRYE
jgi:putative ABC transport system permease protein